MPGQVADAVAVRVGEAPWVDLIDHRRPPPSWAVAVDASAESDLAVGLERGLEGGLDGQRNLLSGKGVDPTLFVPTGGRGAGWCHAGAPSTTRQSGLISTIQAVKSDHVKTLVDSDRMTDL